MWYKDDDGRHIGQKVLLARFIVCLCIAVVIGIIALVRMLLYG